MYYLLMEKVNVEMWKLKKNMIFSNFLYYQTVFPISNLILCVQYDFIYCKV